METSTQRTILWKRRCRWLRIWRLSWNRRSFRWRWREVLWI